MTTYYLACDLGAESGRLMLGALHDGKLQLEEIHRFPNVPQKTADGLHWNIPHLQAELHAGLKKAAARKLPIASFSTDSWGVDYLLFNHEGAAITPTFHYRDARTARGVESALSKMEWNTIFGETGIQFMPINTLFQLAAESPERLHQAKFLLGVGDAFNYFVSGTACIEESMASTFQLYNPQTKAWSDRLISALDFPSRLFPKVVPSGTRLGPMKADLAQATGLSGVEVVATCSHDTGTAVAAVPASGRSWAYLSSGTWSLIGIERAEPILTDACRKLNFTNEIGFGGSIRLLKNIVGLWIVQECRRAWASEGRELDYATLTELAAKAEPFASLIDVSDPRFIAPDGMPAKIASYCQQTKQPIPETPGAVIRCVLEGLALAYGRTLREIERLTGEKIECLHVIGGGSKNALLNQFTANALQIPVYAGPVEATAAGNVLIQAIALGHLPSLSAAREVVRKSFPVSLFQPQEPQAWKTASDRLEKISAAFSSFNQP